MGFISKEQGPSPTEGRSSIHGGGSPRKHPLPGHTRSLRGSRRRSDKWEDTHVCTHTHARTRFPCLLLFLRSHPPGRAGREAKGPSGKRSQPHSRMQSPCLPGEQGAHLATPRTRTPPPCRQRRGQGPRPLLAQRGPGWSHHPRPAPCRPGALTSSLSGTSSPQWRSWPPSASPSSAGATCCPPSPPGPPGSQPTVSTSGSQVPPPPGSHPTQHPSPRSAQGGRGGRARRGGSRSPGRGGWEKDRGRGLPRSDA